MLIYCVIFSVISLLIQLAIAYYELGFKGGAELTTQALCIYFLVPVLKPEKNDSFRGDFCDNSTDALYFDNDLGSV